MTLSVLTVFPVRSTSCAEELEGGAGLLRRALRARLRHRAHRCIAAPLGLLTAVLAHQEHRASQPEPARFAATVAVPAEERRTAGRYPLLDLSVAAPATSSEAEAAVTALTRVFPAIVPEPLAEAGFELSNRDEPDRHELVETWLDDPTLLDPRLGFWIGVAAAPILETAVACPICGGPPQASVIAEESGEFMAGSPTQPRVLTLRHLVGLCPGRVPHLWRGRLSPDRGVLGRRVSVGPGRRLRNLPQLPQGLRPAAARRPRCDPAGGRRRHTDAGPVGSRARLPPLEPLTRRGLIGLSAHRRTHDPCRESSPARHQTREKRQSEP